MHVCQVTTNDKAWKHWLDSDEPEEETPPEYHSLNTFKKLLLIRFACVSFTQNDALCRPRCGRWLCSQQVIFCPVRSWCPDRTVAQARKFIVDALGARFTETVVLQMEEMWKESDARTPLLCLLSMGSEPTKKIHQLAKKLGTGTRVPTFLSSLIMLKGLFRKTQVFPPVICYVAFSECRAISMGQGQEVHARRLIAQFMTDGGWALLQNCHLGEAIHKKARLKFHLQPVCSLHF